MSWQVIWEKIYMEFKEIDGFSTILIFILAAALMSGAQTVVTTGLSGIITEFATNSTTAQWIYSSFLLVLGVMIPTSAFIIKRYKIKTIIVSSLAIFVIGCLISVFAPNIYVLIFSRVIQAFGCGILLPVTQIVLFKSIPEDKWQVFMGLFGLIIGVAPAIAPTFGGLIIDYANWRAIFVILIILAAILLISGLIFTDLEFETGNYSLNLISLVLTFIACVGIMFGFSNIAVKGFDFTYVILPIVAGIVALIIYVYRERRVENPLLNLSVLKNKYFVFGTLFSSILFFTMCGINVMMPLFVQSVAYYSATISGLIILPGTIIMILFNFVGPLLATKIGVRKVLILSCIFTIVGFLSMMTYTVQSSVGYMIATQIIRCIGAGLGLMPAVTWTISMATDNIEDSTAINTTIRQIIGAIGSAITVMIMSAFAGGNIGHNQVSVSAFTETSLVMIILTVISLIMVLLYIRDKKETIE